MTRRPLIGIVGYDRAVARFFGELTVLGVPRRYADQVRAAGGAPVVVAPEDVPVMLDRLDGLVLTGGGDVDPALYGSHGLGVDVDRARDHAELAAIRPARGAGTPLLAICRGMQLLAVAAGGTLVTDLGMTHVRPRGGHLLSTTQGSAVHRLLGGAPFVTSLHHQAVDDPGSSWRATAWSDDGVVEAMEWTGPDPWPALGVQWHPELDDPTGPALFGWLLEAGRVHYAAGHAFLGA